MNANYDEVYRDIKKTEKKDRSFNALPTLEYEHSEFSVSIKKEVKQALKSS